MKVKVLAIPKHVLRSYAKANPSLHEQLYDPIVLLHLCWQPPFEITPLIIFLHSSTSETKSNMNLKRKHLLELYRWACSWDSTALQSKRNIRESTCHGKQYLRQETKNPVEILILCPKFYSIKLWERKKR